MQTKTAQHTPGPWTVNTWEYEDGKRKAIVIENKADAVCEVYNLWCPDEREEEKQANARLIAAAPAMLEALKASVLSLEWAAKVLQAESHSAFMEDLNAAKQAITQAEGR